MWSCKGSLQTNSGFLSSSSIRLASPRCLLCGSDSVTMVQLPRVLQEEVLQNVFHMLQSRRERLGTYTCSAPLTSRQDRQVRVTTCRDHVICTAWGHMTSEPCEPTGVGACRARIASHASHPVRELTELASRAVQAIRCKGLQSSQTILYISSEDSPMESSSSTHVVIRTTRSVLQYKPRLV